MEQNILEQKLVDSMQREATLQPVRNKAQERAMQAQQKRRDMAYRAFVNKQQEYMKLLTKLQNLQDQLRIETDEAKKVKLVKWFNNNLKKLNALQKELGYKQAQ